MTGGIDDRAAAPRIRGLRVHAGANLHSAGRCATLSVEWSDVRPPSPGWREALATHPALAGEATVVAAAIDSLGRADGAGDAVARLAVALQRALGHAVPDPAEATGGDPIVVPIWDTNAGVAAVHAAVALIGRSGDGGARTAAVTRSVLDRILADMALSRLDEGMVRLVARATGRGIPWGRTIEMAPIVRLGDGIHQIHFDGGSTSRTSKVADAISIRKSRAAALMRRHGIPVPAHRLVRSAVAAVRAAAAIGYPAVVKPVATNTGTAVHVDLRTADEVRRAYDAAAQYGAVLVEQMIPGDHTRLLVIRGRCISAMRLDPAQVVGDGRRSVGQLIDAANFGRTPEVTSRPKIIAVDDEAIAWLDRQGLTLEAVPAAGQVVRLRHGSNLSRGGSAFNVRGRVHPDNLRLAERAAAVLALDIAGVDLITPDVERSHREVGGMICEINSGPSFYTRESGYENEDAILDAFFPGDRPGRVPIVCLLGEEDEATTSLLADLAARLVPREGRLALLTPRRAEIGGWSYLDPPARLHDAAAALLGDPETGAALMLLPHATVAADGLAWSRCDLALVATDDRSPAAHVLRGAAEETVDPADRAALDAAVGRAIARPGPPR